MIKKQISNILLLALIVGASIIYIAHFNKPKSIKQDVSNRPVINILFIGNSYTFFNDMPKIIEDLADHDPDAPFRVETHMFVEGGATLASLLTHAEINKLLTIKQWHYVVLQPQSLWATTEARTAATNLALGQWNRKINKIGALPVFFMTWPRASHSNDYKSQQFSFLKSPEIMYGQIQNDSKIYAKKYDMLLAPIGSYWISSLQNNPELNLYNPDGSHPSQKGSFLTALLFHKMLISETLDDIIYYPEYLNEHERAAIFNTISAPLPPEVQ